MLKQIKRHLFASQQDIRKSTRAGDDLARFNFLPISSECFQLELRVKRGKNFLGCFQSGDHHFFRRDKSPLRVRVARQDALRGDISATEILTQKKSYARIERAFV